jgi:two-component system LytT family response regulator
METIKALIVADEPADRQSLRLLIRRLPDFVVVGECEGREDLLDAVRELDPDLVLLDAARLPALLGREPGPEGSSSPANGENSAGSAPGPRRFAVKRSNGRITLIAVEDLLWAEAARDYVRLHTADGSHLIRETMARIEQQLDPHSFVRVHRSTIVRVDSVREIKYDQEGHCLVLLSDGAERAASRAGRKRLQEALGFSI